MKKFLFLALCMVMACMVLVGCDDEIGSELYGQEGYYANGMQNDTAEPKADIDMYVVVSDLIDFTDPNVALQYNTVVTELNAHIEEDMNVKLYVHYIHESEYYDTIVEAVKPGYKVDSNNNGSLDDERECTADIVLINSKQLFDALYSDNVADNMLLSIDAQLDKNGASGRLKAIIPDVLWDACEVEVTSTAADGTATVSKVNYVVPNNRVIGEYEFLLVNRADLQNAKLSERQIGHGNFKCTSCGVIYELGKTYHGISVTYKETSLGSAELDNFDVAAALKTDSASYSKLNCKCGKDLIKNSKMIDFSSVDSEDVISVFKAMYGDADYEAKLQECTKTGTYADKVYFANGEHTDADGDLYYCNIISYPSITAEEAFESAFAVVRDNANALKSMDIICALNNDATFANLLQYGEDRVNYTSYEKTEVDANGKTVTVTYVEPKESNLYLMNPLYCGNFELMYYYDDTEASFAWGYSVIYNGAAEKWTLAQKISAVNQNKEADANLVK